MHGEGEMKGKAETILNCQWRNMTKNRACVVTECAEGTGLTAGEFCVRQNVSGKLNEEAALRANARRSDSKRDT
jgi:hypothetical protein